MYRAFAGLSKGTVITAHVAYRHHEGPVLAANLARAGRRQPHATTIVGRHERGKRQMGIAIQCAFAGLLGDAVGGVRQEKRNASPLAPDMDPQIVDVLDQGQSHDSLGRPIADAEHAP